MGKRWGKRWDLYPDNGAVAARDRPRLSPGVKSPALNLVFFTLALHCDGSKGCRWRGDCLRPLPVERSPLGPGETRS